MKFEFKFLKRDTIKAYCVAFNKKKEEYVISSYLFDIEHYLEELKNELIKKTFECVYGQVWAGDFIEDKVHIYWLYDPDEEEGKAEISRKGMLQLVEKWIEFRKKEIPKDYENYSEIIEVE